MYRNEIKIKNLRVMPEWEEMKLKAVEMGLSQAHFVSKLWRIARDSKLLSDTQKLSALKIILRDKIKVFPGKNDPVKIKKLGSFPEWEEMKLKCIEIKFDQAFLLAYLWRIAKTHKDLKR